MTIGLLGLGLFGGSLAKSIKKHTDYTVLGLDKDPAVLAKAQLLSAIDKPLTPKDFKDCDYLLLALYPDLNLAWLEENATFIAKGTRVIDCGGVKTEIARLGDKLSKKHGFLFVGGHPMAGREVSGFRSALGTLFHHASMILTPPSDITMANLAELKDFFLTIGFEKVTLRTPEEHDKIIAYTSQLAHILSSAYMTSETALLHEGLSAGSFRDLTRVASMHERMWTDIFLENREHLLPELDALIERLALFRDALQEKEKETLLTLIQKGNEQKKACFGSRIT